MGETGLRWVTSVHGTVTLAGDIHAKQGWDLKVLLSRPQPCGPGASAFFAFSKDCPRAGRHFQVCLQLLRAHEVLLGVLVSKSGKMTLATEQLNR
jgi:hypothetical protein